jgi:ADP-ribose pyrophosphatase YjhB (NUDIX family)
MDFFYWIRKVQAIAQTGLAYSKEQYDRERYEQLEELVAAVQAEGLGVPTAEAKALWQHERGYATPKISVRAAVFSDDKVLLVKERSDGKWTLPGGWVDINLSPSEAVATEVLEESGFQVRPIKLAAIFDSNRHPPQGTIYQEFKLFFICEIIGGQAMPGKETEAAEFFPLDNLPVLSLTRASPEQIKRMFKHHKEMNIATEFD